MKLTQKQIVQLNDKYREYVATHTDTKSFLEYRKEYMKELKKKDIERAKREYHKNGRKIRSLVKAGKVVTELAENSVGMREKSGTI